MHVSVVDLGLGAGGSTYLSHGEAFYTDTAAPTFGAVAAGGGPASAPIQPGSLTAPGNGYLYVTGVSISASGDVASINSGFTIRTQVTGASGVNVGFALADTIQATAAALNPQWSGLTASDNLADMAYWAPAGAPPAVPACRGRLSLMGVGC
jgi:hypothetical protein